MNKKGFTLVELLVAITILGIISALALPGLSKLQSDNRQKKFAEYADTLKAKAKLYTEDYEADMFGPSKDIGKCHKITMDNLADHNLFEEMQQKDMYCRNDETYILVKRVRKGQFIYAMKIKCTSGQNEAGGVLYESKDDNFDTLKDNCPSISTIS